MKGFVKFIIIFLLIILAIGLLIFWIPITNNIVAKSVEISLKSTALPPQTEIKDSISVAGKLTGNGNGMQYFGAILIKTELSQYEIEKYFKEHQQNELKYNIKKQNSRKIEVIEHGNYSFKNIKDEELDKYYIVYSWGSSDNDLLDLDIRGH